MDLTHAPYRFTYLSNKLRILYLYMIWIRRELSIWGCFPTKIFGSSKVFLYCYHEFQAGIHFWENGKLWEMLLPTNSCHQYETPSNSLDSSPSRERGRDLWLPSFWNLINNVTPTFPEILWSRPLTWISRLYCSWEKCLSMCLIGEIGYSQSVGGWTLENVGYL